VLLSFAFIILLQFNKAAIFWRLASIPLVLVYPWMKRVIFWSQFFLGLTFNWGVFVGWTAAGNPVGLNTVLLYGAGILWTLAYDTIYAYQDYTDDLRLGIKSSAIWLGLDGKGPMYFVAGCWG